MIMKLAGHADLNTTMRYVHLNDEDVRAAMKKARVAEDGHKIGHSAENVTSAPSAETSVMN